jgi:PAS domain S-box-containing protein
MGTTDTRTLATDVKARLERQLDAAQQIAHLGSWEWDLATGVVTWSDELYRLYGFAPRSLEITLEVFLSRLHPDDRERIRGEIEAALARGGRFQYLERIVRPDGSMCELDTVGEVLAGADGRPVGLIGTCRDVTEERRREKARARAQRLQVGERQVLETLAGGAALPDILAALVGLIEELVPESIASILLLDESGTRMRHGAAPRLPEAYNRAIDGVAIGPNAGSCGTAAYLREPVVVTDIATDPRWDAYRDLALPHGLIACWSLPILATDGHVLGTFAVYHREPRGPDETALELVGRAAHVAGIVIERRQLDDQLRALSERIEAIREEERTGIAREIHDELGQALTALKMDIAWVKRRVGAADGIGEKLDDMSRTADEIIHAVRRISAELRPGILDDLGLQAAIEWQADEFTGRTGIPCRVDPALGDVQLERGLATAVFRIFQEALTNVARHADATEVLVAVALKRGQVVLEVSDDGIGVTEKAPRGLGLLGMRERARQLGGDCVVRRRDPRGTTVALSLPLRFPAERRTDTDAEIGR